MTIAYDLHHLDSHLRFLMSCGWCNGDHSQQDRNIHNRIKILDDYVRVTLFDSVWVPCMCCFISTERCILLKWLFNDLCHLPSDYQNIIK